MLHPTALITGATGGLGTAFADYLARHGHDLVLVARRRTELTEIADTLARRYGREVKVLPADLTDHTARLRLVDDLARDRIAVTTLINNAGFGYVDPVAQTEPQVIEDMVTLNCTALAHLTRLFLVDMLHRRNGVIVNVASTASFQPMPFMATYAATKAFVASFSQGVAAEVKGSGVQVLAVCPGPTESAFWTTANAEDALTHRRTPQQVVETTARALRDGKTIVTDGALNKAQQAAKVMPSAVVAPVVKRLLGR